ncbi:2-hydroxyacid dehydrogenase [Halobacteriovorax sp. DPLXC-1]|uniref:2-hydroxyacid dehydrogenase n=1 Tax=Halobacteriovorax sp. DPLXC-1 TaxID=3110771 RepID=UPI002FF233E5
MKKFNIFATDIIQGPLYERLKKDGHKLTVWDRKEDGPLTSEKMIENANDSEVIISMLSNTIDAYILAQLPKLKLITQYAVGFNNIDIKYAHSKEIIICNTPNVLTEATAELAMALMLAVARNLEAARKNVLNNEWETWEPSGFIGNSLFKKKHGIIGAGRIGTQLAKMCKGAFDQEIYYTGPNRKDEIESSCDAKYLSLEELAKECDIISIHCPYNEETHKLIDKEIFALFKNNVILINTARGEIIDEEELFSFFDKHKEAKAGLDVVCNEPLKADSPLRKLDNVFILPHIGSANDEARLNMAQLIYDNISAFSKDEELKTRV